MKEVIACLLMLSVMSCSVKPEPLQYGKDACHACKMTLVDGRFGAELITKKGKIYKFDDINCLVGFYKSGLVVSSDVHSILAIDYATGFDFIDATTAFYVISDEVRSPMRSDAAVFAQRADADKRNATWKGEVKDWNGILLAY